jgi:hypothetical protein
VSTTLARVRVTAVDDGSATDSSNGNFSIAPSVPVAAVRVTAPNGGEQWLVGTGYTIAWTSSNAGGTVKIELSRDGGGSWSTLAAGAPNNGSFGWTAAAPATQLARVRISSVAQPTAVDTSDSNFALQVPVPTVSVSKLTLKPTSVRGGTPSKATVKLSGPAPAGGVVVTLGSTNPAAATVPASVEVAAGANKAKVTVTTRTVTSNTTATISAVVGGGVPKTAVLKVSRR